MAIALSVLQIAAGLGAWLLACVFLRIALCLWTGRFRMIEREGLVYNEKKHRLEARTYTTVELY